MVPTVERGFLEVVFWSIAMAGDKPEIDSTLGLFCKCKNCLA